VTPDPQAVGETRAAVPDAETRKALEAILLVVEEPVEPNTLAQVLEMPTEDVVAALRSLRAEYVDEGRGFVLREVAGGWRLYTDPGAAPYVERFVLHGRSGKLSQAALETLAIVAYKQPVTRSRVSEIRGVDADGAVRSLVVRGLIEEVGREPTPGQPLLYATTPVFLERLGISDVAELPSLPELLPDAPLPAEPQPGGYKSARRELDALSAAAADPAADDEATEE
jgi:segregation and condensation protein B